MNHDMLSDVMAWEDDKLDDTQEDALFQHLVDTGLAWTLQGMYGRRAQDLLTEGRIHRRAN